MVYFVLSKLTANSTFPFIHVLISFEYVLWLWSLTGTEHLLRLIACCSSGYVFCIYFFSQCEKLLNNWLRWSVHAPQFPAPGFDMEADQDKGITEEVFGSKQVEGIIANASAIFIFGPTRRDSSVLLCQLTFSSANSWLLNQTKYQYQQAGCEFTATGSRKPDILWSVNWFPSYVRQWSS